MFALRLYLDMMVHDLYGYNETTQFFARLMANRFSGLEHLFPPSEDDPDICSAAVSGKIPTCIHIHGYAKLDMAVVGSHFEVLSPEVRDILFQVLLASIIVSSLTCFFKQIIKSIKEASHSQVLTCCIELLKKWQNCSIESSSVGSSDQD